MSQSKANQWIHVLLPALLLALRELGDAPTRCLTALAQRLGVPNAVAAEAVSADEPPPALPHSAAPVAASFSPFCP